MSLPFPRPSSPCHFSPSRLLPLSRLESRSFEISSRRSETSRSRRTKQLRTRRHGQRVGGLRAFPCAPRVDLFLSRAGSRKSAGNGRGRTVAPEPQQPATHDPTDSLLLPVQQLPPRVLRAPLAPARPGLPRQPSAAAPLAPSTFSYTTLRCHHPRYGSANCHRRPRSLLVPFSRLSPVLLRPGPMFRCALPRRLSFRPIIAILPNPFSIVARFCSDVRVHVRHARATSPRSSAGASGSLPYPVTSHRLVSALRRPLCFFRCQRLASALGKHTAIGRTAFS